MREKTQPHIETPASKLEISDDIIAELNIQFAGYYFQGKSLKRSQQMSMDALKNYGSDRVRCVPITQEMLAVEDYGFGSKKRNNFDCEGCNAGQNRESCPANSDKHHIDTASELAII